METPITISLSKMEATFLWGILQDILNQDSEGKLNGQGGILYPEHVGCGMRVMGELAEKIDAFNAVHSAKEKVTKISSLKLV